MSAIRRSLFNAFVVSTFRDQSEHDKTCSTGRHSEGLDKVQEPAGGSMVMSYRPWNRQFAMLHDPAVLFLFVRSLLAHSFYFRLF
jgi:hypothetical protein